MASVLANMHDEYNEINFKATIAKVILIKASLVPLGESTDSYRYILNVSEDVSSIQEQIKTIMESFVNDPYYTEKIRFRYFISCHYASLKPYRPSNTQKITVTLDFERIK